MSKGTWAVVGAFLLSTFFFQNCSDSVEFNKSEPAQNFSGERSNGNSNGMPGSTPTDTVDDGINNSGVTQINRENPDSICNPLDPTDKCDSMNGTGLIGKLYYLTPEQHKPLFNDQLGQAKLKDYREHGIQVPVDILMASINITPRSWTSGFIVDGEQVKKENGEKLFEWFHLDLFGFLNLPAGDYQIATLSDDGIRVTLNDKVIVEHDSTHSPTYDCASEKVSFKDGEKKFLRVEYFQGPRTQIALQLLVRPWNESSKTCNEANGLTVIDSVAYSNR